MSRKRAPEANEHAGADALAPGEPHDGPARGEAGGLAEAKRPPAHVVRLGRIKATIWLNQAKDGRAYYGVTAARVYRTGDGEWAQATSFDRGDLLPLAEALRLAFLWICENPVNHGDDDTPF